MGLNAAAIEATTPVARAGRSLGDALAVRSPAAMRTLLRAAMGLARRGRPRVLTYMYERAYLAYDRRDWELNTIVFHPTRYTFRGIGDVQKTFPDMPERFEGHRGFLDAYGLFADAFDEISVELLAVRLIAPGTVEVESRFRGTGRGSGVPFEQTAREVHVFEDGLLVDQTYSWI